MSSIDKTNYIDLNKAKLAKAGYDFAAAFTLPLLDSSVSCNKIARILPKKRLVAFGIWQEKAVVAKIFFGAKAKERFQKEVVGSKALQAAKIPTPAIYYEGPAQEKGLYVILFERIVNAVSLGEYWREHATKPEGEAALQALTLELATQHVLGLSQQDLHLNNFLHTPEKIITLDGAAFLSQNEPLSTKESLDNLALLFSQLGINSAKLLRQLFEQYRQARSWLLTKSDHLYFEKALQQWNQQRWLSYSKKIFRSSSQFRRRSRLSRRTMVDRAYLSPAFENFLQNPDAYFTRPTTLVLKEGRSSTVVKIEIDNKAYVVKRYNIKDSLHRLKRFLTASRAEISWRLSHQLLFFGLSTAKPVAFIEKRFLSFRGKAYFIMEFVEGQRADHFFDAQGAESPESFQIAQKMLALFLNLAHLQLTHGDLKITNLIITPQQDPLLLDLDGMRVHPSHQSTARHFRKDWQRFLNNWPSNPTMQRLFEKKMVELLGC